MGIAPEHQNKVFDMFSRFSTYSSGSGIGLYLVRKIIGKYNGKVTIDSTPEVGTTFSIFLKKTS